MLQFLGDCVVKWVNFGTQVGHKSKKVSLEKVTSRGQNVPKSSENVKIQTEVGIKLTPNTKFEFVKS